MNSDFVNGAIITLLNVLNPVRVLVESQIMFRKANENNGLSSLPSHYGKLELK